MTVQNIKEINFNARVGNTVEYGNIFGFAAHMVSIDPGPARGLV